MKHTAYSGTRTLGSQPHKRAVVSLSFFNLSRYSPSGLHLMSFPEEPLDLSIAEGGGYYPATIRQNLMAINMK